MIAQKGKMAVQSPAHTLVSSCRDIVGSLHRRPHDSQGRPNERLPQLDPAFTQQLQGFIARFTERSAHADVRFDALAKSLRSLYQAAHTLAGLVSEQLGRVRAALQATPISGPDGLATVPLQDLRDGLAETATELKALRTVGEELCRVCSRVRNIEKLGLAIRTSVSSFAIESARTAECQESCGSFAAELRALGDRISVIAESIDLQANGTRHALARELEVLDAGHGQLSRLAQQLETTATATASAAQHMLEQVLLGLQQAEQHMLTITQQASEAVFYLQYGDIIRQKSEHISAALRTIDANRQPATDASEVSRWAKATDHVLAVQGGQLELIQTEVAATQQKLAASFQDLARAGEQLHEALNHWEARSSRHHKEADSLAAFKADVRRMEELHHQGLQLRQGTQRSKQNAINASNCLAGYVDKVKLLNADIHLHALNAIVRTSALGPQGATLSVLSMYVDSLYRESRDVVTDLVTMFESVLQQTRTHSTEAIVPAAAIQDRQLQAGVDRMESACNDCRVALASANTLVTQQHESLQSSRALLSFLGEHAAVIAGQIQELKELRAALAPLLADAPAVLSVENELHERYTMQSERNVHDNLVKLTAVTTTTPLGSGENIELFAPATPQGAVPASASAPTRMSLSAATTLAPTATGPELSDNVELF